MTSQVAVYNLNGIGIASDTVATSRTDAGPKTTGNSEKIFEIGPKHKVVAIHYGSTSLNDLHHQFHFNRWVETIPDPLPNIEAYLASYIEFCEKGPKYHSDESEAIELRYVIRDHYKYLLKQIGDHQNKIWQSEQTSDEEKFKELAAAITTVIKDGWTYLNSLDTFDGLTEADAKAWFKAKGISAKALWQEMFEGYELSAADKTLLTKSGNLCVLKEQDLEWDSYLAFIGYGTDDPFPSVQPITCRSLVAGKLLASKWEKSTVEPGNGQSQITRFAQSDAIEAFLRGYNNDIYNAFHWAIGKHFGEALGPDFDPSFLNSIRDRVTSYVTDHSWRTYTGPILRQIQGMNVNTLGELATTLVGMQATSSASKDGPVSVGGLIEVVTIDRINGVQWKSRLPR